MSEQYEHSESIALIRMLWFDPEKKLLIFAKNTVGDQEILRTQNIPHWRARRNAPLQLWRAESNPLEFFLCPSFFSPNHRFFSRCALFFSPIWFLRPHTAFFHTKFLIPCPPKTFAIIGLNSPRTYFDSSLHSMSEPWGFIPLSFETTEMTFETTFPTVFSNVRCFI